MSTTQNPSYVCDTHHISLSPVDQQFQRSTAFPAADVAESTTIGPGYPDDVLSLRRKSHLWPVYLVNIPEGFDSKSWRTAPPHTKHFNTAKPDPTAGDLLKQHGLEIHQASIEECDSRLNRLRGEI